MQRASLAARFKVSAKDATSIVATFAMRAQAVRAAIEARTVNDMPTIESGPDVAASSPTVKEARKLATEELTNEAARMGSELQSATAGLKELPRRLDKQTKDRAKLRVKRLREGHDKIKEQIEVLGGQRREEGPQLYNYMQMLVRAGTSIDLKGLPLTGPNLATLELGAWWDLAEEVEGAGEFRMSWLKRSHPTFSIRTESCSWGWGISAHNSRGVSDRDTVTIQTLAGGLTFIGDTFVLPSFLPDGPEHATEFEMYAHLRRIGASIEDAAAAVTDSEKTKRKQVSGQERRGRRGGPRQVSKPAVGC